MTGTVVVRWGRGCWGGGGREDKVIESMLNQNDRVTPRGTVQ